MLIVLALGLTADSWHPSSSSEPLGSASPPTLARHPNSVPRSSPGICRSPVRPPPVKLHPPSIQSRLLSSSCHPPPPVQSPFPCCQLSLRACAWAATALRPPVIGWHPTVRRAMLSPRYSCPLEQQFKEPAAQSPSSSVFKRRVFRLKISNARPHYSRSMNTAKRSTQFANNKVNIKLRVFPTPGSSQP